MTMSHTIIKNARIINENNNFHGDVYIRNDRIERIDATIGLPANIQCKEIDAKDNILIPGMIDAHVHFRDPGLTYKGDIETESSAAIAGGVTTFMDMPNTLPNVLTKKILEEKYSRASERSFGNFSFFMGLTQDNLEEALKISTEDVCGLTDDGLYFDRNNSLLCNSPDYLEKLFSRSEHLVALHSEDESIIKANFIKSKQKWNGKIPPSDHSEIRSALACLSSTKKLVELTKKHKNRLHLLHVSTGAEALLFDHETPTHEKRITAEACVHHLYFNTEDYWQLGNKIKWNPSIKSKENQFALLQALHDNKIDMIATDHAPHDWKEKLGNYEEVKPGGPMIQHALPVLLEMYHKNQISLEKIVEKTSHQVAEVYRIKERGFIREGYFADLVMVDLNDPWKVTADNVEYKCQWSPVMGKTFRSKIKKVFVNGVLAFDEGKTKERPAGMRLKFDKTR
jgi:dihydroorotase